MDTLTETSLQITLYKTQLAALEELAAAQGLAVEDLIHQAIEALLTAAPLPANELADVEEPLTDDDLADDPLRAIIGLGRSGVTDLAENHDKYLMEFEVEDNRRWLQKSS